MGSIRSPQRRNQAIQERENGNEARLSDAALGNFSNSHVQRPYDIFLVHTGHQKGNVVATLRRKFRDRNYSCFVDRSDLRARDGSPITIMAEALESCRHVVVVLSAEFLARKDPRAELIYAHKRMEWIRDRNFSLRWESLWVVLYDLTVEEYEKNQRDTGGKLPELWETNTLLLYNNANTRDWDTFCDEELVSEIFESDTGTNQSFAHWESLLEGWPNRHNNEFPSACDIYNMTKADTGLTTRYQLQYWCSRHKWYIILVGVVLLLVTVVAIFVLKRDETVSMTTEDAADRDSAKSLDCREFVQAKTELIYFQRCFANSVKESVSTRHGKWFKLHLHKDEWLFLSVCDNEPIVIDVTVFRPSPEGLKCAANRDEPKLLRNCSIELQVPFQGDHYISVVTREESQSVNMNVTCSLTRQPASVPAPATLLPTTNRLTRHPASVPTPAPLLPTTNPAPNPTEFPSLSPNFPTDYTLIFGVWGNECIAVDVVTYNVFFKPCDVDDEQSRWAVHEGKGGFGIIKNENTGMCLTYDQQDGNNVLATSCDRTNAHQHWRWDEFGRVWSLVWGCLDLDFGNPSKNLYVHWCHDGINQRFRLPGVPGNIRLRSDTNQCIGVENGNCVLTEDCSKPQWHRDAVTTQIFLYLDSSLCLDYNFHKSNLKVFPCFAADAPQQYWNLDGEGRLMEQQHLKCVGRESPYSTDLRLYSCLDQNVLRFQVPEGFFRDS